MKKLPKLLLAILLVLSLSLSICACDVIDNIFGKDCESHVDADKDGKCDECEAPVETQPECTHSDKNDDGKCDECTADFTDGCDNHVDLDDNGVCDVAGCNEACIDGCDNHVDLDDNGVCDITGCDETCIDGCDNHVDLDDNGVCDVTGCDEAYTDGCNNHVDANLDHVCDSNGCSVVIGTCADADLDHDCDYGCSKVWGDHADADLDHDCDYGCNVAIGDHADADLDHDCDYGCSVAIGNHADADLDHDCDYGCNVAIGVHADADLDHDCDYGCSVAFGTCEDADKDHACDYGCDATFGTEEDKNDDRECDYCGEAFEDGCDAQHRDANDDGKCDFGGEDFEDGAEPIVLTEDVEVMGSAKSAGQELIYKLTASTTGAYGIEFWGSYFDINVYCEDTSTQAIYTKTGIISSHNDTVNLEEGEVYYFVLTYQENFESYVYLTVSAPEAEEPEASENGESFNTAFTLENGVVKEGDCNYNTTYYKFIPTATGSHRIVIGNASYYDINIYSADDLTTAINTWSTEYSGNLEQIVELEEGETYYIVLKSNYGYGYKLTVSYRPECTAHEDANDDAKCDVCGDTYTDGCDLEECIDLNNDGLCDNANCDAATENKAAGSTFENAIDLSLDTATTANIVLYGQKIYFKFTATTEWYSINVNPGYYSTLALYDATNTTTALFTASGSSASQTLDKLFNVTVGNDYYLAIGSSQSKYEYSLTMAEAEDPFVSATDFAFGEEVQNVDFTAKEEKYYVYTATATGEYVIYVESGSYNSTITFYNADKTAIATFQGVYDYNVGAWGGYAINATQALSANETYYIVIASSSSYSATLKISVTAPAAGDTEPEEPECTEHKDANDDGFCDNEGCGVEFTDGCDTKDCLDTDNDGLCDNDGCDKATTNKPGFSSDHPLTLEEGVEAAGSLGYGKKVFYKLTASATSSYRIIFSATSYKLYLYSADDLTTAKETWSTDYSTTELEPVIELVGGNTYYFVVENKSYYEYKLTVSVKPDCSQHIDADDTGRCDVCAEKWSDGCDMQECLDVNGDGLCDNANCDEATTNKAIGSSFDMPIEITIGETATASIVVSEQKIYLKFTATAEKLDLNITGRYAKYYIYNVNDTETAVYNAPSYTSSVFNTYEFTVGDSYYIVLSNTYSETANYTIDLTEWVNPFDRPTELSASENTVSVSYAGLDLYYTYTADATGDHRIYINGYYYKATVTVYDANRNAIGDPVVASYDSSYYYVVDFTQAMTAGETYYIVISINTTYSTTFDMIFSAPADE